MAVFYYKKKINSRPFTYTVITPAAILPLTLDEVKNYLKIDLLEISEDDFLNLLIEAVTDYFEEYTGVTLINTTYRTYRDEFCCSFRVKKSPLSSVELIEYVNQDNNTIVVDSSVYSNTLETFYSQIYLNHNQQWPNDVGPSLQGIKIDFIVGFGPDASFVPTKIKIGLLQHIAMLYENRGDCVAVGGCDCASFLPITSKAIYNFFRIREYSVKYEC